MIRSLITIAALGSLAVVGGCANNPFFTGPPQISTTPTSATVTVPISTQAQAVVGQIATDCGLIANAVAIASAIAGFPAGTAIATMAKQFCSLAGKAPAGSRLGANQVGSVVFKGVRVQYARSGTQAGAALSAENQSVIFNGVVVPYR